MRIDIAEAMICEMILKSIEQDDVKAIEAVLSGGVDPNKPLPSQGSLCFMSRQQCQEIMQKLYRFF